MNQMVSVPQQHEEPPESQRDSQVDKISFSGSINADAEMGVTPDPNSSMTALNQMRKVI